jgi:AraC-like DNA-binding protein
MIKTIALLIPVYVTIFWTILLFTGKKKHSNPRSFLAKFMFLLVLIFTGKFFLYEPYPDVYFYYDPIFLYVGCLTYPFYHIYFRLLTVDENFSWKAHSRFLILPIVLVSIYEVAVLFAPSAEYKVWLFDRTAYMNLPEINLLSIFRNILKIFVKLQVVYFLIKSTLLLRKYKDRAEQFYSDIQDGKYNNAKLLNYLLIFNCLLILIPGAFFAGNNIALYVILPLFFAIDIYMIGLMGFKQKPINPTFEVELDSQTEQVIGSELNTAQKELLDKLLVEFKQNKIYLNSELNIMDVVQLVGSNRSTISSIINQQYSQNFCAFVNGYRIIELEKIIINDNNAIYESLAERAGFGSVKSMHRAVVNSTELSIKDWKKQIIESKRTFN